MAKWMFTICVGNYRKWSGYKGEPGTEWRKQKEEGEREKKSNFACKIHSHFKYLNSFRPSTDMKTGFSITVSGKAPKPFQSASWTYRVPQFSHSFTPQPAPPKMIFYIVTDRTGYDVFGHVKKLMYEFIVLKIERGVMERGRDRKKSGGIN